MLKAPKTGVVYEYPLTDFVMEDQFLILKRHELTAHINANLALPIPVKKGTSGLKMTKGNVNISLILLLLLVASLVLYWSSTNRKNFLTPALFSLLFLIFITCSVEEDPVPEVPAVVAPVTPPAPEENTDTDIPQTLLLKQITPQIPRLTTQRIPQRTQIIQREMALYYLQFSLTLPPTLESVLAPMMTIFILPPTVGLNITWVQESLHGKNKYQFHKIIKETTAGQFL